MKNIEAFKAFEGLCRLSQSDVSFPAFIGYKIIQNRIAIANAVKPYVEIRNEMIKKHSGGKNEIDRNSPEYTAFENDMKPIDSEDIDVEIKKIKLDDIAKISLSMAEIDALAFMIE